MRSRCFRGWGCGLNDRGRLCRLGDVGFDLHLVLGDVVLVAGGDEVAEERVRLQRLGFELGGELAAEEEGGGGDLDDFEVGGVGGGGGEGEAASGGAWCVPAG